MYEQRTDAGSLCISVSRIGLNKIQLFLLADCCYSRSPESDYNSIQNKGKPPKVNS